MTNVNPGKMLWVSKNSFKQQTRQELTFSWVSFLANTWKGGNANSHLRAQTFGATPWGETKCLLITCSRGGRQSRDWNSDLPHPRWGLHPTSFAQIPSGGAGVGNAVFPTPWTAAPSLDVNNSWEWELLESWEGKIGVSRILLPPLQA